MTNLIHKEEIKKIKASENENENQFLEKSNENNELNSKIYIYITYILFDHGSRERNQRMMKILLPKKMRFRFQSNF